VAEQATIALENAQVYGETDEALRMHVHDLEQRNRHLAEMVRIGNSFRVTFSVQQLGELITHAIHTLVDTPRVLLGLVDRERGRIHIRAGLDQASDRAVQSFERSLTLQGLTDWLAQARPAGTFSYQLQRHPWLPEFENVLVLMIHDSMGSLIGAIFLECGAQPLTPGLMRTLEIVANQAGIALTNTTLYLEQQQTVDRLTALNALSLTISTGQLSEDEIINMAIAGAVGTTGGQGGGAVIVVDGRAPVCYQLDVTTPVSPEWLQQLVHRSGEYSELVDGDVPAALHAEGIQRLLVVPLRGANLTVGTLWIGYIQPTSTKAERETAVLYAKMTGAVLENLYLAGAVRNAHDRMASILLSTREGMLLVGEDGRISITNRAFGDLLGIDQMQLLNRTISDIAYGESLGMLPDDVRASVCGALHKVVDGTSDAAEGQITLPGATDRYLTWNVLRVHAATRDHAGALLVIRDVTADRQMERLRQDLANMIVHDLRSPLTNILVSVDLLLKPATGPLNERQQRILSIATSSGHQMLDLVNALLDIRRLEQHTVELQRRPLDLPSVTEAVTDLLEHIAEDKAVRVIVNLDSLPQVEIDQEMIRRVLQNLVDNALKFSPPETNVHISGAVATPEMLPPGHPDGQWVVVEVRDQGTGVPEEYQQVIFQLFVQAPEGHGHGTGIGLSFCRLAVEAHGGRIWVESTPGKGSTFRFTLPQVTLRQSNAVFSPRRIQRS
jgi:PAS domain S-box-containing protein